jgi:hypothetical protein
MIKMRDGFSSCFFRASRPYSSHAAMVVWEITKSAAVVLDAEYESVVILRFVL